MTVIQQEADKRAEPKGLSSPLSSDTNTTGLNSICRPDPGRHTRGVTGREKKAAVLQSVQAEAMFAGVDPTVLPSALKGQHLPRGNSSSPGPAS